MPFSPCVFGSLTAQAQLQTANITGPTSASVREGQINSIELTYSFTSTSVTPKDFNLSGTWDIEFKMETGGTTLKTYNKNGWSPATYVRGWQMVPLYHNTRWNQIGPEEYEVTVKIYVSVNNDNCRGERPPGDGQEGDLGSVTLYTRFMPSGGTTHGVMLNKIDDEPSSAQACSRDIWPG